eukprot:TRINITY_DN70073_c0_g1_i1.p1 TRINITY_DN70073_c0_g1~~TRINITY_DN70073_c0_g1_i1.p1  ORF type:complete len:166 (-),score=14.37 TRINITY_DN70073_c0_g1_i1:23-520(-)
MMTLRLRVDFGALLCASLAPISECRKGLKSHATLLAGASMQLSRRKTYGSNWCDKSACADRNASCTWQQWYLKGDQNQSWRSESKLEIRTKVGDCTIAPGQKSRTRWERAVMAVVTSHANQSQKQNPNQHGRRAAYTFVESGVVESPLKSRKVSRGVSNNFGSTY